jgi:hypothetical protein
MTVYLTFFLALIICASAPRLSSHFRTQLAFAISFIFVGLRYEMAFDWPYYKEMYGVFASMSSSEFFDNFAQVQLIYPAEPGFLTATFLFGRIFADFEVMQASIYLLFLASFWTLGRQIGTNNFAASLIIVHLFLLFTLEFSTIRQSIALSLFNFGLAFYISKRKALGSIMFLVSALFQLSSLMYVAALMIATTAKRRHYMAVIFGLLFAIPISSNSILLGIASFLPPLFESKLIYYVRDREVDFNAVEVAFTVVFYTLMIVCAARVDALNGPLMSEKGRYVLRLISVLSVVAFCFLFEHVFRNRIFYEVVILFSLLAFSQVRVSRTWFLAPVFSMGLFFLLASFGRPVSYMYLPYQNYIWNKAIGWEGDGDERAARLSYDLRGR